MRANQRSEASDPTARRKAVRFVLLIGLLSFFADFTYEGSRSVLGPYLAVLGASATVVGIVSGLGELLGYGSQAGLRTMGRRYRHVLANCNLRICGPDGVRAGACIDSDLAASRSADSS